MNNLQTLIAAGGKKVSPARKSKIKEIVKKSVEPKHEKKADEAAEKVLNTKEAPEKDDQTLINEIKALLKPSYMVTSAAKLIARNDSNLVYKLTVTDQDSALLKLLQFIKKCGDDGHSISFKIDDQSFGFDGDGADKIMSIDIGEAS